MRRLVIALFAALILFITQSLSWGGGSSNLYEDGVKLFQAGNYLGAVDKLNQALQTDSDKAQIYTALGKALFNLQRVEESRHAFEEALKINSESVSAQLGILMIEAASGRCHKVSPAIENMKDARLEVDEIKALYRLQVGCDRSDNYKTIERLTNLINLEGSRADINEYLYLWQLYSETDQPSRALEVIEKILKISDTPDNREIYAVTLLNNGQVGESINEYRRLIQKNPRVAEYHMRLANALTAKEKYDEAKKEISIALSIKPKDAGLYYAKAIVELIKKEYDQCIESSQFAIDNGNDKIKAEALFISGECDYAKGNINGAVKKYKTLLKKYPQSDKAAFVTELVDNIRTSKNTESYQIDKIPFIKKRNHSSLSTALNMVLNYYWPGKFELSEKEIAAIEFDGRMPSSADVWLLLKGKGFESLISPYDISLIKALVGNRIPIIMNGDKASNYWVITGFDERTKLLYYSDPAFINRLGQLSYNSREEQPGTSIIIIMPLELLNGLIEMEKEKEKSATVVSTLSRMTLYQAITELTDERDGFQVAKKIHQLYPKICEAKLVMAETLFARTDYKKAIANYDELLTMDNCSLFAKGLAYLKMAVSYNKLGDMRKADQYLEQARQIDSEADKSFERLIKVN